MIEQCQELIEIYEGLGIATPQELLDAIQAYQTEPTIQTFLLIADVHSHLCAELRGWL